MAAEIIDTSAISKGALSFFSGAGDAIVWIILLLLLLGLIWIIYYLLSFKIKVVVRERVSNGKTLIKIDKAKIKKDRNGVHWIRLFKYRVKLPEPDGDYFDLTTKGKKIIEYSKVGADFTPINIVSTGVDIKNSFSPAQRQMMIHECRESENYRKRTTMDLLRDAIPYMALVLIILGLLIFMPDIIESKTSVVNAYDGVADKLYDVADRLAEAGCNSGAPKEVLLPPD